MFDKRPTERFTSRVENYVRYRPDYPAGVMTVLRQETGLDPSWTIADIGSGPGNFTRLLLDGGHTVVGVEPNDAMREAGNLLLGEFPGFSSVNGTAEATTLPTGSIDLVTAGQAFHWFDPAPTRTEFQRILKAPGWVALVWNRREEENSPFLDDHHAMLRQHAKEFDQVSVRDESAEDGMSTLFGQCGFRKFTLPHAQRLTAESYWGRLLSSSYTPLRGEPGHEEIKALSSEIFRKYATDGAIEFPYETQIFLGTVLGD